MRAFRATEAVWARALLGLAAALGLAACAADDGVKLSAEEIAEREFRAKLVAAARAQVGQTTLYDGRYAEIAFPMGDIPRTRGVCSDVIVRAFRDAGGIDLQAKLHRDMRARFDAYPTKWGLTRPDPNIDHRRVLNLETFLTRMGARLPMPADLAQLRPGDVLTWRISGAEPHIGVVSDRRDPKTGRPLIIHNFAKGAVEEDFLWAPGLTGRFKPYTARLFAPEAAGADRAAAPAPSEG